MKKVWLIGPGNIGIEYVKVLQGMDVDITAIGRSPRKDWIIPVYEHGLDNYISQFPDCIADYAIVAVDESQLYLVTKKLITKGVKNILVEKPAGINKIQISKLERMATNAKCNLFVAYNRRFYQSVQKCKEKINQSEGPISVNFSFTEWTHAISFDTYSAKELERFVRGILINYNSNWESAGRWSIEICLPDEKLILRPLEKLHVQRKGSLDIVEYKLQHEHIDLDYKAGLYEEVKSFLTEQNNLCTIAEQVQNFKWFYKMANYK